jgi:hypothetical protein
MTTPRWKPFAGARGIDVSLGIGTLGSGLAAVLGETPPGSNRSAPVFAKRASWKSLSKAMADASRSSPRMTTVRLSDLRPAFVRGRLSDALARITLPVLPNAVDAVGALQCSRPGVAHEGYFQLFPSK